MALVTVNISGEKPSCSGRNVKAEKLQQPFQEGSQGTDGKVRFEGGEAACGTPGHHPGCFKGPVSQSRLREMSLWRAMVTLAINNQYLF